jgi:membrane fusion protein (multidrug efflux system)
MIAFLRQHFFMALAGLGVLLMAAVVLVRALTGSGDGAEAAKGGPGGPPGGAAGAQTSKGGAPGGPGAQKGGGGGGGGGGRPATVSLMTVAARDFDDRLSVPGTVLANESITVTTKVTDVVDRVLFESGQSVRAGATLIVLARTEQASDLGGASRDVDAAYADANAAFNEADSLARDLEAARAGVAEAEAGLTVARLAFERTSTLAERGFASQARLDADRAAVQGAEARVRGARERVAGVGQRIESQRQRAGALRARADAVASRQRSAQSRLSDRTITAPFSGVIGLRNVSPGQLARPGEALATLDDISQVKVDFDVPENRIRSVVPGTEVRLASDAVAGSQWNGFVRFTDTRIDPRSRTMRARAYIANPDGVLRPGMLMSVEVRTPARSMPAVPEVALQEEGIETFVFLAQRGERGLTARRVPVRIGARRDGWVEVMSGVSIGDQVITEGLVRLRDGQGVRPLTGAGPGGGAPGGAPGGAVKGAAGSGAGTAAAAPAAPARPPASALPGSSPAAAAAPPPAAAVPAQRSGG